MSGIVFVCTGNICRSPMAEGILRHRLETEDIHGIDVSSMGVSGLDHFIDRWRSRHAAAINQG